MLSCFLWITLAAQAQPVKLSLQKMITARLESVYPAGQYHFIVSLKWLPESLQKLNTGQLLSVAFDGSDQPLGYCLFDVDYHASGKEKKAKAQVYVQVKELLPVAKKRMMPGQTLSNDDVKWTWIDITKMNGSPVNKKSDLQGLVLSRIITTGSVIKWSDLHRKPVMMPGDEVTLIYNFKGIEIDMHCEARQSGAVGDRVRLYNRETGKTYIGEVTGSSTAIWKGTL